jgi:hypothetical protein
METTHTFEKLTEKQQEQFTWWCTKNKKPIDATFIPEWLAIVQRNRLCPDPKYLPKSIIQTADGNVITDICSEDIPEINSSYRERVN